MKALVFILLVVSNVVLAQNRFQYQVTFKIDSTNRDFVQKETFNLDFQDNETIFYPEDFAKMDSIVAQGGSINKSKVTPKLDYLVFKNHQNQEVKFQEMVGLMMFLVPEPRHLDWKILSETKKYENYNLQKATTHFAGRKWVAWFSSDIQIPDGPYKFRGLPGLIFSVEDEKRDYVFELSRIQKIEKPFKMEFLGKLGIRSIKTDFDKFQTMKKRFVENPEAFLKQVPGFSDLPAEELKKISDSFVKRGASQNNKIELSAH